MVKFANRADAGRQLARALAPWRESDVVVLGLPRGGVPVAAIVAESLDAPLDVIAVKKLGLPGQPEVAMGAIAEGNTRVLDPRIISLAGVTPEEVESVESREERSLAERTRDILADAPHVDLTDRVAIIVDDGIATGATARAACIVARARGAARVIVAAPVAPVDVAEGIAGADEVVCLSAPENFWAVGAHYTDFSQTSDREVAALLDAARERMRRAEARHEEPRPLDVEVVIPVQGAELAGSLVVPSGAHGIVVFAHGSGSSRHSPRNRFVASRLHGAGIGTLLLDLLTTEEEQHRAAVFDIELLGSRLVAATEWLAAHPETATSAFGYFGASTGAGAALWAAARPESRVAAIVSRGGRPDLAGSSIGLVRCPVLLIVGGADDVVLQLNRDAQAAMTCESSLLVVDGATHLFEEPGALASVADAAADWFSRHLQHPARVAGPT